MAELQDSRCSALLSNWSRRAWTGMPHSLTLSIPEGLPVGFSSFSCQHRRFVGVVSEIDDSFKFSPFKGLRWLRARDQGCGATGKLAPQVWPRLDGLTRCHSRVCVAFRRLYVCRSHSRCSSSASALFRETASSRGPESGVPRACAEPLTRSGPLSLGSRRALTPFPGPGFR